MTNREFFTAIINANINADITAHANAEVAKLDKKNAKRKSEGGIKAENKPIADAILQALEGGTMISADLAKFVGQSTQKINGVAGEMVKIGLLTKSKVKVKNKGEVVAYTLVVADDTADDDTADEVAE